MAPPVKLSTSAKKQKLEHSLTGGGAMTPQLRRDEKPRFPRIKNFAGQRY